MQNKTNKQITLQNPQEVGSTHSYKAHLPSLLSRSSATTLGSLCWIHFENKALSLFTTLSIIAIRN